MDEEEEKKKFETEENDGKGKKKRLNIEALCERLKIQITDWKRVSNFSKLDLWISIHQFSRISKYLHTFLC